MKRGIVVFERDERHTHNGQFELDFRLIHQALPSGSCPLAMATDDDFTVQCGQWFTEEEVINFTEQQSSYKVKK